MLHRLTIPVTAFDQNASLIWCDETQEAALVDPGGDIPKLMGEIERRGLTLKSILLTHAHIDHAGATGTIARTQGVPIIGPHRGDDYWIEALPQQSQMFGFPQAEPFTPDRWLEHGDTVQVGNVTLEVLHCPGHTPGHVVFYDAGNRHAYVGDVLFAGSVGRTDFPGGNHAHLMDAIKNRLFALGDEVTFTPGHGPESHLGEERLYNPFLR